MDTKNLLPLSTQTQIELELREATSNAEYQEICRRTMRCTVHDLNSANSREVAHCE